MPITFLSLMASSPLESLPLTLMMVGHPTPHNYLVHLPPHLDMVLLRPRLNVESPHLNIEPPCLNVEPLCPITDLHCLTVSSPASNRSISPSTTT